VGLIQSIYVPLNLSAVLDTSKIDLTFNLSNPFDTDIYVSYTQGSGSSGGTVYAMFAVTFDPPFHVPAKSTRPSPYIHNVPLTQGALGSLGVLTQNSLDVDAAATAQVGQGGYTIPFLKISQKGVPTTFATIQ
jgi:hypothetical protein